MSFLGQAGEDEMQDDSSKSSDSEDDCLRKDFIRPFVTYLYQKVFNRCKMHVLILK